MPHNTYKIRKYTAAKITCLTAVKLIFLLGASIVIHSQNNFTHDPNCLGLLTTCTYYIQGQVLAAIF